MLNCRENLLTVDENITEQSSEDVVSHSSRRTFSDRRCTCQRRYIMAMLLSVFLAIEVGRRWSNCDSLKNAWKSKYERKNEYPSLENWTIYWKTELHTFSICVTAGCAFMNILGGLLVYHFSTHKFIFVNVTSFSILHALMHAALKLHSTAFLWIVMIGQEALAVSVRVAVLSVWKAWAPPAERTVLVTVSCLGIVGEAFSTIILVAVFPEVPQSISCVVDIAGIIWALIWYKTTSSTPQCDPRITEKEYFYLERTIPSNYQEKTSLKEVPWKCMLKSKQVAVICLIFFNLGSTIASIIHNTLYFSLAVTDTYNILTVFIPFMASFIFVFIGSSFLMDYLLRNNKTKTLMIRKIFLCSGLVLHRAILLESIRYSSDSYIMAVLFAIACCCLAFSIPGILRYPLDISSRYVPIIAGVAFGFYQLGWLCIEQFIASAPDSVNPQTDYPLCIYENVLSLVAAIVFGIWGNVDEQSWSLLTPSQRRGNDNSSNPQSENEDEVILVPGTE